MNRDEWAKQTHEEVAFWDKWLKTKGGPWSDDFQRRLDPLQRLPDLIENALHYSGVQPGSSIRILDLGCGPLSSVGTVSNRYKVEVVPIDPLADHYQSLLEKHHIAAPILPQKGEAEKLDCLFPPESFDVVWARNSLDHSYDPLLCIYQAYRVLKAGGTLIIVFHPNEADQGNYQGLHNWNFDIRNNAFIIASRGRQVDVSKLFGGVCKVKIPPHLTRGQKSNMHVKFIKKVDAGWFDLFSVNAKALPESNLQPYEG